jgi:hypothetical protein
MFANLFAKSEPLKTAYLLTILLIFFVADRAVDVDLMFSWGGFFGMAGTYVLLMILILIADFVIRKNFLTGDNAYALLLMVFLFGIFRDLFTDLDLLLANLTLFLAFRKIYSLRSAKNIRGKLFDAGFWIGVSTLIFPWSFGFVLLVLLGVLVYKRHELRNFFVPLFGMGTPIFVYYVYHRVFESGAFLPEQLRLVIKGVGFYDHWLVLTTLLFTGVLLLFTLISGSPKATTQSYNRKFSWVMLWYQLIIAAMVTYLIPEKSGNELIFLFFPASVLVTNLVQKWRSTMLRNLVFLSYLALGVLGFFYVFSP